MRAQARGSRAITTTSSRSQSQRRREERSSAGAGSGAMRRATSMGEPRRASRSDVVALTAIPRQDPVSFPRLNL
jgi:hypothetical protein